MELKGKKVLITRPSHQAEEMVTLIKEAGGIPVHIPMIEIKSVDDLSHFYSVMDNLELYDWLVLTSSNSVRIIGEHLSKKGAIIPHQLRIAAVGSSTAKSLEQYNLEVNHIPKEFTSKSIIDEIGDVSNKWILLPQGNLAKSSLADAFCRAGGIVHQIILYQTNRASLKNEQINQLNRGTDIITFTSSSTIENFKELLVSGIVDLEKWENTPIYAHIGPVTAETAEKLGIPVDVVADEYNIKVLIKSIQNYRR